MKFFKFGFIYLTLFSCTSVFGQTDPCSTLADMQSKTDDKLFVGFGSGDTQKSADQNAQVDLARNIRQKLSAESSVEENKNDVELKSNSKSVVSESLVGAKVLRRCSLGSSFSAVMTLSKKDFINSLSQKINSNVKKAIQLKALIEKSNSDDAKSSAIESAKKFLADYQNSTEEDYQVCKIYDGCSSIKLGNEFQDLSEIVATYGDADAYLLMSAKDEITKTLREELKNILENNNYKIIDSSIKDSNSNSSRKILALCKAIEGSKIPGSSDRVIETKCTLEAYVGKQKKFHKVYSCKSLADKNISTMDAVQSCSGRLKEE